MLPALLIRHGAHIVVLQDARFPKLVDFRQRLFEPFVLRIVPPDACLFSNPGLRLGARPSEPAHHAPQAMRGGLDLRRNSGRTKF
jgi:hypothetical protein